MNTVKCIIHKFWNQRGQHISYNFYEMAKPSYHVVILSNPSQGLPIVSGYKMDSVCSIQCLFYTIRTWNVE